MLELSKYLDDHRPEVLVSATLFLVVLAIVRIAILTWGVQRNRSSDRLITGRDI